MNDKEHDDLVKMLMDSTTLNKKEELDIQVNPNDARTHQTKKNEKTSVRAYFRNCQE